MKVTSWWIILYEYYRFDDGSNIRGMFLSIMICSTRTIQWRDIGVRYIGMR